MQNSTEFTIEILYRNAIKEIDDQKRIGMTNEIQLAKLHRTKQSQETLIQQIHKPGYKYWGHPDCAINGKIKGVSFSTFLLIKGQPKIPSYSPFGEQQMQVPVEEIISRETALYFADFYCNPRECAEKQPNPGGRQKRESEKILEERRKKHFITLVVCDKNSDVNAFCSEKLISLDKTDNKFLWAKRKQFFMNLSKFLIIEVFVTQDLTDLISSSKSVQFKEVDFIFRPLPRVPLEMLRNGICPKCGMPMSVYCSQIHSTTWNQLRAINCRKPNWRENPHIPPVNGANNGNHYFT